MIAHLEELLDSTVENLKTYLPARIVAVNDLWNDHIVLDQFAENMIVMGGFPNGVELGWPNAEVAAPDFSLFDGTIRQEKWSQRHRVMVKIGIRDATSYDNLFRRQLRTTQVFLDTLLYPGMFGGPGRGNVVERVSGAYRHNPEQGTQEFVSGALVLVFDVLTEEVRT